jgi:hypothetical protein
MIEIHQPPLVKVIDGMPEDEDGKNGRQRLTVERERHRVLAMSDVRPPVRSRRSHRLALR